MSLRRKSTKTFTGILFLLCAIFLLHLIITPIAITKSYNNTASKQKPFNLLGRSFIVADFTGSEILTDMKTNHEINRNLRDFRRLLDRTFNALMISMVGLGLALYYMQSITGKIVQRKPILSTSMGGHAPPMI